MPLLLNERLIAALQYTEQGYSVVPVYEGGKRPFGPWEIRQTTPNTAAELTAAFKSNTMLNIGIVCGPVSGNLVVLDVDVEAGGVMSLMDLIMDGMPSPNTVQVETGSGGFHYYYIAPAEIADSIQNSASQLGPGLDVRAKGGQVVAPPSIHANGNTYKWVRDHALGQIEIEPLPQYLIDRLPTEATNNNAPNIRKVVDNTGIEFDSFGKRIDGRRDIALKMSNAAFWHLRDQLNHEPSPQEIAEDVASTYFVQVRAMTPETQAALDQEDPKRGYSMLLNLAKDVVNAYHKGKLKPLPSANSTGAPIGKAGGLPSQSDAPPDTPGHFHTKPLTRLALSERGQRQYLVPFRHMRGHITLTAAAPGVGKSTFGVQEAVSATTGLDFLRLGVKPEPLKVYILNNEETRDEIERRIEATCTFFGVPLDGTVLANLFIHSGVDDGKFKAARTVRDQVVPTDHLMKLQCLLAELKIDLLIIDPFVQAHHITEGSNEEISQVMEMLREMAGTAALHIIHHIRKPPLGTEIVAGDLFSLRGAGAIASEAHFVFTMTDMIKADAEAFGIPEDERNLYLRQDDAKGKFRPPEGAAWLQRTPQPMPYGLGEDIGVLVPWEPPEIDLDAWGYTKQRPLLEGISQAYNAEQALSAKPQSGDRYVVNWLMRNHNVPRPVAKDLLREWIKEGTLLEVEIDSHSKKRGLKIAEV